jgi:replicative DNA helicase
MRDILAELDLPANPDAEQIVLASILRDSQRYELVAEVLPADDFSVERHRRIFLCMADLNSRGGAIDRVTLANELRARGQLEADGISYLVSLDDDFPRVVNLDHWIRIIHATAIRRRGVVVGQNLIDQCMLGQDPPEEILTNIAARTAVLADSLVNARQWFNPGEVMHPIPVASMLSWTRIAAA